MNSMPEAVRRKASSGIARSTRPDIDSSRKRMPETGVLTSCGVERNTKVAACASRGETARPAIESGKRPSATSCRA